MNNHPDWAYPSPSPRIQHRVTAAKTDLKVITTIAVLALSYYILRYLNLWPETLRRRLFEILVTLIPLQFVYIMQLGMSRLGLLTGDGSLMPLADLKNNSAQGEVLSIMFGAGNKSITNVVRKARTMSGVDRILPPSTELGPAGLGNWDNSCYQNSVIHGFASLPAFNMFVNENVAAMDVRNIDAATHRALTAFLGLLNDPESTRRTLWTPSVLKSMDSWQQQDAQEYFSRILDAIEKENTRLRRQEPSKCGLACLLEQEKTPGETEPTQSSESKAKYLSDETENTATDNLSMATTAALPESLQTALSMLILKRHAYVASRSPVDGMLAQGLQCQACAFTEGLSLTQFNCLTVNMGTGGQCSIEQLLDEYTAIEEIEGVECTQCTKMAGVEDEVATTAENAAAALPSPVTSTSKPVRKKPVLSTKAKQITVGRLPVDLVIHINRSIFDNYGNQRKNTSNVDFPIKLAFANKWCAPLNADADAVQAIYDLKCIITHYGRHENGHYVAYAKKEKTWYCFNDEIVTLVTEQDVLQRGNAFMLFYEMSDTTDAMLSLPEEVSEPASEEFEETTSRSENTVTEPIPATPPSDSGYSTKSEAEDETTAELKQGFSLPVLRTAGATATLYQPEPLPSQPVAPVS